VPPVPRSPTTGHGSRRNLLIALGVAVVAAAVLIGAAIAFRGGGGDEATPTTTTGAPGSLESITQSGTLLGDPEAKVTLIQFEDLQCPICKQYTTDAFPTIVDEYVRPGKINVEFRGLAFIGEDSQKALRIALAAGKQDKLWQVVEAFYANQGAENSGWVTDAKVDEILAAVPGLDAAQVKKDASSSEVEQQIIDMQNEAQAKSVQGTPWFFVKIGDAEPYEVQPRELTPFAFYPILDDALES
jgi:protein-disulfide isomerase